MIPAPHSAFSTASIAWWAMISTEPVSGLPPGGFAVTVYLPGKSPRTTNSPPPIVTPSRGFSMESLSSGTMRHGTFSSGDPFLSCTATFTAPAS